MTRSKKRSLYRYLVCAICLLLLTPIYYFFILPSFFYIPEDFELVAFIEGTLGLLNITTFELDSTDIIVKLITKSIGLRDDGKIVIISNQPVVYFRSTGKLMPPEYQLPSETFGVCRYTYRYVQGYGEREVEGLWTFPFANIERKTYRFFDFNINRAVAVKYQKTCKYHGLDTYIYYSEINNASIPVEYVDRIVKMQTTKTTKYKEAQYVESILDLEVEFFYTGRYKYYVDTITALPLNIETEIIYYVQLPDVTRIPPKFKIVTAMEGILKIVNTTYLYPEEIVGSGDIFQSIIDDEDEFYLTTYQIYSEGEGRVIDLVADNQIALIEVNSTTYDKTTGEKLPDELQQPTFIYGVDRDSFENVPVYGDKPREGLFLFKLGLPMNKSLNYSFWHEEPELALPVSYNNSEYHGGLYTYVYEAEVNRVKVNASRYGIELPPETELVLDGKFRYWVEPNCSMIIDNYRHIQVYLVPTQTTAEQMKGKLVFELELQGTPEMTAHWARTAKQYLNLLKHSEAKIIVLSLNLTLTNDTIETNLEKIKLLQPLVTIAKTYLHMSFGIVGTATAIIYIYRRLKVV